MQHVNNDAPYSAAVHLLKVLVFLCAKICQNELCVKETTRRCLEFTVRDSFEIEK